MATNDAKDWNELVDLALFDPSRIKLRQRIEHAKGAIQKRMEEMLKTKTKTRAAAYRNALHCAMR